MSKLSEWTSRRDGLETARNVLNANLKTLDDGERPRFRSSRKTTSNNPAMTAMVNNDGSIMVRSGTDNVRVETIEEFVEWFTEVTKE